MHLQTVGTPLLWISFTLIVLALLAIDLGVFHRKAHVVRFKEAMGWTIVWIVLSLLFNLWVYDHFGPQKGLEFLTGYLIEKALSVDNIFVFIVIFAYFAVPRVYQHRVLFWGVIGALVLRGIFIWVGAALLQQFHWVIYVFGALLVATGIKLLFQSEENVQPERNPIYRLARRFIPAVSEYHGQSFTVVRDGRRFVTPLFLVLIAVEASDVLFAVDSIPAIFAITNDPFIVYTSNVCAILGLRALYFVLADIMDKFHFLKIGLALVLLFVGAKMLISTFYKIPIGVSLAVVASLLTLSIAASLFWPKKTPPEHPSS
ncbi:MAG TPA: TerC family protein [Thermoanaerobaculia bacterium]|nr:TerC family protein [Thermoanaerobaculia bacterium]